MRTLFNLGVVCLLCALYSLPSRADSTDTVPLNLLNSASEAMLAPAMLCSRDFNAEQSISEVLADQTATWQPINKGHIRQAFSQQPVWCQLQVKTISDNAWLLGIADPNIGQVDVYFNQQNTPKYQAGSNLPFATRLYDNRFFYFPIPNNFGQTQSIHLRLQSLTLNAPVQLLTDSELASRTANRQSLSSMAFGFLFPLLLSFFAIRKMIVNQEAKLRYWSAGIALAYTFTSTVVQGFGFQFFWPNATYWNHIAPIIATAIGLLVLWQYLKLLHRKLNRIWESTFSVSIAITVCSAFIFYLTSIAFYFNLSLAFLVLSSLVMMGRHLFFAVKNRGRVEDNFWTLWLLLVGLCLCQGFGLIHLSIDIELAMAFNFSMLVLLLGSDIYRLLQLNQEQLILALENQVTQEQAIAQLQYEKNTALEEQVTQRTQELNQIMRELHLSNMRLRTASNTDALTGIMNRYAGEHYIEKTWAKCLEQQRHFSVGFIDADYFKQVNDNYGHDAGDDCLKQLANIITQALNHVEMRVARYGGEEFLVIAPDNNAEQLFTLLDDLRKNIESMPIISEAHQFTVTVSIGVAGQLVTEQARSRVLIKQADASLYQAKNNGRNQVILYSAEQ